MRRALFWALSLATLAAVLLLAGACTLYAQADVNTVGELRFENELAVPPLLEPSEEDGRKVFDLTLEAGETELLPGKPAETWGANGSYLGPTLRAARGDDVVLRVRNELPEATTLHWHGMHLPAAADGGPHQLVEPGDTWSPAWEIDQPAATLWYHPHPHGETADHVYRGVAGFFLLDDPAASALGLPDEYGVNDIPLVIQDKRLHEDGALDLSEGLVSPTGLLGDRILVNGTYDPYVEVRHESVRFRLLNGSNARVYDVGLADGREFDLVGTDGGLLEAPERLDRVQLTPGERAEIVVAFEPGEEAVLRSFAPDLGASFWEERFAGGDDSFDLLEIRAAGQLASSTPVPARLSGGERLDEDDAVRTRRFELNGSSRIDGERLDLDRIDAVLAAGAVEVWEVENRSGTPHSFHPHGVTFRVLEVAGEPPPPELAGPKDTVFVPPDETVRFVLRAPRYADPDEPYMFHCHVLQHEDRGMMGQFVVE